MSYSKTTQAGVGTKRAQVSAMEAQKKGEEAVDSDALLDSAHLSDLHSIFLRCHKMRFPVEVEPSEQLISRLTRQLNKRCLSVKVLASVSTMAHQAVSSRRHIGLTHVEITLLEEMVEVSSSSGVNAMLANLFTYLLALARA